MGLISVDVSGTQFGNIGSVKWALFLGVGFLWEVKKHESFVVHIADDEMSVQGPETTRVSFPTSLGK